MKKDLHITLSRNDILYLDALAKEKGCSRNDLVSEAVAAYRAGLERARVEADMRADAEKNASHSQVFEDIEPHAIEVLLRETEW